MPRTVGLGEFTSVESDGRAAVLGRVAAKTATSKFARLHPTAYLSLYAIAGLLGAIACAWLFAAIAEDVPEQGAMDRVDLALASWLQVHGSERGEAVFSAVSWLGTWGVAVLFVAVVSVFSRRREWRRLALFTVAVGGAWLLDTLLKAVFQRARPTFATEFVTSGSWSFPSGHALESFVAYGLIAHFMAKRYPDRRRTIHAAAVVLIAAIGFSRLYLGVHFLSDVAAGYMAGFVWLYVCIVGYQFAGWRQQRSFS